MLTARELRQMAVKIRIPALKRKLVSAARSGLTELVVKRSLLSVAVIASLRARGFTVTTEAVDSVLMTTITWSA